MDKEAKRLDEKILRFIRGCDKNKPSESDFTALALELFDNQFRNNFFYRKFCGLSGIKPQTVRHWKDIPAIPAEAFKELRLVSFPAKKAVRVFRSSGTTLPGKRGAHYFETLKLYDEAIVPSFKKYLLPDRAKIEMYFLMASPKELRDSSLSYMMGRVLKAFGVSRKKNRFYVKKEILLSQRLAADLSKASEPVMLLATALSLKSFLDYLRDEKITLKLKSGSRVMETGGFKGRVRQVTRKALYRDCEKRLGVLASHCVSEYGMTELSSQFYDTTFYDFVRGLRRKPFKTGPAWTRTLVLDPLTGRQVPVGYQGILRHFDLANRASVMAVQTQDMGIRRKEGFELIGRLPGASLRGCSLTYEELLRKK